MSAAPTTGLVTDLLSAAAGTDRIALIDRSAPGVPHISHRELWLQCRQVAGGFRARGLGVGDRVGILADNCSDYYRVFFGALHAGCAIVPLNTRLPVDTQQYIAADAALKLVIADDTNRARLPSGVDHVVLGSVAWAALADGEPLAEPPADLTPQHTAVHIYTSGSTGRPKGVLLSHHAVWWTCTRYGATVDAEVMLVSAPLYHKNALMASKLALTTQGTVVLLPRFTAVDYIDAVEQHRVTMASGVPTMYALVTAEIAASNRSPDFSSVRRVLIGSAPLTEALYDDVARLFPNAIVGNGYGTTEAVLAFTAVHPEGLARPKITVGHRHPLVELKLVDGSGAEADEGELWIRSPGVMDRYHNLDEVTAERLTDGWYHTGDLMRRDGDGWYFFVGRVDDMFVCAGENIYPDAVEQMLERHAAVHQAVVVPVHDELKGQLPTAFVRVEPGHSLTADDVKQFALAHGPAYAHPRHVWFVDEIPLASTNKIDRRALVDDAARRIDAG